MFLAIRNLIGLVMLERKAKELVLVLLPTLSSIDTAVLAVPASLIASIMRLLGSMLKRLEPTQTLFIPREGLLIGNISMVDSDRDITALVPSEFILELSKMWFSYPNRGYECGGIDYTKGLPIEKGSSGYYEGHVSRKEEREHRPPGFEMGGSDFGKVCLSINFILA